MRSDSHTEEIMLCMVLQLSIFNYSLGILINSVVPSDKLCPLSKNVFFGIKKKNY